ncbi:hypothetical protein Leryth_023786 [Lithospermum erythrorhizon]|nr:hypothetical protein Leryth_023786 [Lithospermum erythrorhizon]
MEQVKLDQSGSSTGHMSIEQLESSDACLSSGDPEILPRIGDKYQVEIPPVLGESDHALYKRNPVCLQNEAGYPFNFLVGLPIPVTQVGPLNHDSATFLGNSQKSSDRSANLGSQVSKGKYFCCKKENLETKVKPCDIPPDNGATFAASEIVNQKQCMTYHFVPGADVDPWSDYEKRSFVLGLYIFGKDFVQVKKFVENKRMGDILFSYYGGFYGSHEYQRWSGCRKAQNSKCVHGEKLFSGRRQQELLSRLLLSVSDEFQKALLEVSKKFRAGRMGLEEYVFALKAMVGIKILVEAVGIGKPKQDLTSMAIDSSCTNQVMRVKVPAGKACADLQPNEIIKFVAGDYRLSKARASDLFWEAVWPRLLARGWQSEQPKREGKDSLVFLVPGVEKFSRKKLEKGKQYFESVTDILRKVASEPALIELDSEDDKGNREKEDPCIAETEEQQDEITKGKRRRYLQPQTTCRKSSGMKFTVVDTSLPHGLPYKLKELSDLLKVTSKMTPSDLFENRVESTPEVSSNESDTDDAMLAEQTVTDDSSSCLHNGKLFEMPNTETDHVGPATKRLRVLTACSEPAISSSQFRSSKTESPSSCSANHEFENVDLSSQASSEGKTSSTTTSQGCDMECVEPTLARGVHDTEHLNQNGQNMCLVDLNVPEVSLDTGSGVFMTELADRDAHTYQKPENLTMEKIINDVDSTGQQHEVVQRRHGTRNRPPTAKSLEALANGLLTVNNRPRKNKLTSSRENLKSRSA